MLGRAIVAAPLVASLLGVLVSADADAASFWLENGDRVDGDMVSVIGGAVTVRRSIGGLEVFKLQDLARADFKTDEGTVSGRLVSYRDGQIELLAANGGMLKITADGRVIDRSTPPAIEADGDEPASRETPAVVATSENGSIFSKLFTIRDDRITMALSDGSSLTGSISSVTRRTLLFKPSAGGIRPLTRSRIETISFTSNEGASVEAELLDWSDGAHALRLPDGTLAVAFMPDSSFDEARLNAFLAPLMEPETADGAPDDVGVQTADADPVEPQAPDELQTDTETADRSAPPVAEPIAVDAANDDIVNVEVIASSQTVAENVGDLEIEFLVDRDGGAPVSIFYTTVSGAAAASLDYETTQGYVSLGSGTEFARIGIPIIDDDTSEDDEHFLVFFSTDPNRAELSTKRLRVDVADDD